MREGPRRARGSRWLVALLAAVVLVCGLAPVRAWAEELSVGNDGEYVDLNAAYQAAHEGDTLKLTSNLTAGKLLLLNGKSVTIDGDGYTITRAEEFDRANDGRGGYNPAMIEVANGATLTLINITLDDAMRAVKDGHFDEQLTGEGTKQNETRVQDAIIAAYNAAAGGSGSTIILGNGTTLKNFGGMSAVRVGGQGEDASSSSKLIMLSGSRIIDDATIPRAGGVAAVWSQGGIVEMQAGSSIHDLSGRAIYLEDGGVANIGGSVHDVAANSVMMADPSEEGKDLGAGGKGGFAGIAIAAFGNSVATLTGLSDQHGTPAGGAIYDFDSSENVSGDTAIFLAGSTFAMEYGSSIHDIKTIGLVDSNGGTIDINGSVSSCELNNVFFRLRGGGDVTFSLGEKGVIENSSTIDAAMLYVNGGRSKITIDGKIINIGSTAVFVSSNDQVEGGFCVLGKTGTINQITGTGIITGRLGLTTTIEGVISNCTGPAVSYGTITRSSLVITGDARISDNNNGGPQVSVGDKSTYATDSVQNASIASGALVGETAVSVPYGKVTLDGDYHDVKLGKASDEAADKIEELISSNEEYGDWTIVGDSALWIRPSTDGYHFRVSRPEEALRTGLFVAYIPLKSDGTPTDDAELTLHRVNNDEVVDVTLEDAKADTSYAVMLVNNKEYTLAPDDITIYTGGGQGSETSETGFPALTVADSVDPIKSLVIDGGGSLSGEDAMSALLARLEVTYWDGDTQIHDDREAGEYRAVLSWRDGQKPTSITINGNEVAGELGEGTLIVRYVEDLEEAVSGSSTHPVLGTAPDAVQDHAVAVLDSGSTYYLNGDAGSQVTDTDGISILDDSLLTDQGDNRQQLLEQRATESGLLPELSEGQAYRFAFRYLDLVDANNGNAWVSADKDATIYLPYPDGLMYEDAKDIEFTVVHFKDLHREYGITGPDVATAIEDCELETVECENVEQGIEFTVSPSGFSPFAAVWQTKAYTINATAGSGGSISPFGPVTVAEGADQAFAITPNQGYAIADVRVDGASVGAVEAYTFMDVTADHTIEATFKATGGGTVIPSKHYTITSSAGEGGSISPSGTHEYAAGSDVSFSIAPDEGYTVGSVTVDGVNVGQRTSYTFADLDADHTISVTFMPGSAPADPDDTGVSDWLQAGDHIAFLHGYGDGSGTFGPQNDMTRAEVAQMFYNLLLDKSRGDVPVAFQDVPEGAYYAEAVLTLASRGIVNGTSPETYEPNRAITRAEFVAIAMRFSNGEFEGENTFVDVPEDAWYRDYVVGATGFGWIVGYQDGSRRFGPEDTITRGQATMVTNRMLGRVADGAWIVEHLDELKTFVDLGQGHYAFFDVVEATNAHDYERADGTRYESWTGLSK